MKALSSVIGHLWGDDGRTVWWAEWKLCTPKIRVNTSNISFEKPFWPRISSCLGKYCKNMFTMFTSFAWSQVGDLRLCGSTWSCKYALQSNWTGLYWSSPVRAATKKRFFSLIAPNPTVGLIYWWPFRPLVPALMVTGADQLRRPFLAASDWQQRWERTIISREVRGADHRPNHGRQVASQH